MNFDKQLCAHCPAMPSGCIALVCWTVSVEASPRALAQPSDACAVSLQYTDVQLADRSASWGPCRLPTDEGTIFGANLGCYRRRTDAKYDGVPKSDWLRSCLGT